jgi:hypothetical protein
MRGECAPAEHCREVFGVPEMDRVIGKSSINGGLAGLVLSVARFLFIGRWVQLPFERAGGDDASAQQNV